ncbi:MAG: carbohydrate kinase family protein [Chloroflexi bacterium]|nr:carbohydrate kinase family protein [Chloroflexota bacterium]
MQYDIIQLGDYCFDQIFSGMPEFPCLGREIFATELITTGGGMFITAAALTRLGARVGWPGCFGNDSYSQFVYDLAGREGIDLTLARILDRPYRLVTTSVPFQGERAFISYADSSCDDMPEYWQHTLEECEYSHLHIGWMMPDDELRPLVEQAHRKGATVSMDCQDGHHLRQPPICRETLAKVDIFMPNAREALIITEASNVEAAVRQLNQHVRMVVVKDGANGAWIGSEGNVIHAPAICAGPVVDTTGAGDCFNAGFLFGYIVEKAPLEVCARYGNICGGLSVTAIGGATAAPTHDELLAWLEKAPAGL